MISVVVPIFNVECFLEQCLDSLLSQTYENFEVVGVDDCSNDGSKGIFQKYMLKDARFRLVEHSVNMGLPSARNTGISASRADLLFFLDSDDWIDPEALERLADTQIRTRSEIVIGGMVRVYEDTGRLIVPDNHSRCMQNPVQNESIFENKNLFYSVTSTNKLISKDFLLRNNLFFSPVPKRYEDMVTYKWYLFGAKVTSIPDVTYFYRQRSSESSSASIMQQQNVSSLKDKILAFRDIASFSVHNGFWESDVDPLNSSSSMMNLDKALAWVLPALFSSYEKNRSVQSEWDLLVALEALQVLVGYVSEDANGKCLSFLKSTISGLGPFDTLNKLAETYLDRSLV